MRKGYTERHVVSHIVEHIVGAFFVLGLSVCGAYMNDGAFAQTLNTAPIAEVPSPDLPITTETIEEKIQVFFAVTQAPVTDCVGTQPMTHVLFAVAPLSGGTFVVASNSGTDDMKLSWGEYPLPNGTYTWSGVASSGFVAGEGARGTFELKGECGTESKSTGSVTLGSLGTSGSTIGGTHAGTTSSAVVEMVPMATSTFMPVGLRADGETIDTSPVSITIRHEENSIEEEANIYGTDQEEKDTDRDGFVDDAKIPALTNPRGDSGDHSMLIAGDNNSPPADENVQFEDPLLSGVVNTELLAVHGVSVLDVGTDDAGNATVKTLRLSGISPPNRLVTLFIYSDPIVVTVKADAHGAWAYTLDKKLSDGTHHVISAIADEGGRILAKSTPFPFVKEAAAVFAGVETLPGNVGAPGYFGGTMLYSIIAIIIALFGILFSALGFVMHHKKEDKVIPNHDA